MFTVGPVHARDYDPGCSIAGVRSQPQSLQKVGLMLCSFRNVTGGREPALLSEHLEALR